MIKLVSSEWSALLLTQAELETPVIQHQPFSDSPVCSPVSKCSTAVDSASSDGKSPSQFSLYRGSERCCKDELEREIHPLTLTPAGRKRARVCAGTLRDWPGEEWSVGRAEQTVDAPKTENRIEFGHFRKSRWY